MEDETSTEDTVGLDLDNKDQTITITGLSLEDAAKIILREQDNPGHYQILTQDIPDIPTSDDQACVTVVQEVTDDNMGVFEGNLEQSAEAVYITQEMINNGTIQMSDGSLYLTQDLIQQDEQVDNSDYHTVYVTPGELETSQKQTCQSTIGEGGVTMETENTVQEESLDGGDAMQQSEDQKDGQDDCKTLHVNVIKIEEGTSQDSVENSHVINQNEQTTSVSTNEISQDDQEIEGQETQEKYTAQITEEGLSIPDDVKTIDLSKPIEVTDSTEIIIKGKKCVLMPNPDTGQLCAYPVVPPLGKKKRGRPKKVDRKEDQDYVPPALMDEGSEDTHKPKPLDSKQDQANAVEGLLELSNTGPDGVRRSARAKKKKRLADYELLEVSSDEEGNNRSKLADEKDYVPPSYALSSINTGNKRGRGRPRRYPPPGQNRTSSIPAVIIPGANGQTLMMAPIQGLQNFQAFQEHVKSLPSLLSKNSEGLTTINAQIISTSNGQIISTSDGHIISSDNGQLITTTAQSAIDSDSNFLTESSTLDDTDTTGEESRIITLNNVGGELDNNDTNEETDLEDVASIMNQEDGTEVLKTEIETAGEGQTILQIPEDLLPIFIPKKDPVKLGLKASERELEKLKCPKCDFQAFYLQQYQSHIAIHTDDVQKCKCCNYVSFDRDSLLKHFKETHPRCICNICDFMAEHAYVIKRHMMRHSGEGCSCELCGKTYKDQYILKMHVKMVHMPADVLFECTVCFKKFTRKAHLKRHLRIHEAEKPFKCPHCEYRGCERSDISKHILIHEEPKHVCKVCGKAFRHIKNKELHLKRHNGQKDYKCGVCDFYGYTFTDIRKHIERRHADIKTLVCDKCGSAFKSEALLREHQKQQCEVFMIEQGFSIATSNGGTSQATIQIPSSLSVDGQHITIDGQQITVEQVIPG